VVNYRFIRNHSKRATRPRGYDRGQEESEAQVGGPLASGTPDDRQEGDAQESDRSEAVQEAGAQGRGEEGGAGPGPEAARGSAPRLLDRSCGVS